MLGAQAGAWTFFQRWISTTDVKIYSDMDILEREGKREESMKILLAYWKAGREDTKESTQGRAESLHDFKL